MSWTLEEFEKLKNCDTRTFEKLYEMYKNKIYSYFMVKTGRDQDLSSELLSETFFSAINSVSKLKNCTNIQGWLFQIAVRKFNDHLRSVYKTATSDYIEYYSDPTPDKSHELIENEKIEVLYMALDKIKPLYCEVLSMKYLKGASEKEIALKTGKSVGAIEGLLFRARQALKKELGSHSDLFAEEM